MNTDYRFGILDNFIPFISFISDFDNMIDDDLSTYGIVYFNATVMWGTVEIEMPGFDKGKYNGIEIHAGFDLQGMRVHLAHAEEICGYCSQGRECSLECSYYFKLFHTILNYFNTTNTTNLLRYHKRDEWPPTSLA